MLIAKVAAQDFTYTANGGAIQITGYSGAGGNVSIPSTIDGMPVVSIGGNAFIAHTNVTRITIPDGVTNIGGQAFLSCYNLTNITIPSSVTSIGDFAFTSCSSLTNITIPNGVTSIGVGEFMLCTGLANITIPDEVTNLGYVAFEYCSNLTRFAIPQGVTVIEVAAFKGCSSLASLTFGTNVNSIRIGAFAGCAALTNMALPRSLSSVDASAFEGCYSLPSITVDPGNPWYRSVDGVVFQGTTLLIYPAGKAGNYTIPTGVTNLAVDASGGAFTGCTNLSGISIPEGVTDIGPAEFSGCSGLTNVTIPNGLTTIGAQSFSGCTKLSSIGLVASVASIGYSAFDGCSNLTDIKVDALNPFYSSVGGVLFDKSQATLVLYPRGKAGSYTVPESVTNIGENAFNGSTSLSSINIPNSVSLIGDYAFAACFNLTNLVMGQGVGILGYEAFNGCRGLTQVALPAGLTNLSQAFDGCSGLTTLSVDAHNPSYSTLDGVLFDKTRSMIIEYPQGKSGDYTLPEGVTTIGPQAFVGSVQLTNVTIPSSLVNFWSGAFVGCTNLSGLYFEGNAPTVLGYDTNLTTGTVYYLPGTKLWGRSFANFPTAVWQLPYPIVLTSSAGFGIQSNQFSFTVSWGTNTDVVVEASTNLDHPLWQPVQSNSLVGGTFYFSDPQWTNYRSRFYRVRPR